MQDFQHTLSAQVEAANAEIRADREKSSSICSSLREDLFRRYDEKFSRTCPYRQNMRSLIRQLTSCHEVQQPLYDMPEAPASVGTGANLNMQCRFDGVARTCV